MCIRDRSTWVLKARAIDNCKPSSVLSNGVSSDKRYQILAWTRIKLEKFLSDCFESRKIKDFEQEKSTMKCKDYANKLSKILIEAAKQVTDESKMNKIDWASSKEFVNIHEDLSKNCAGYLDGSLLRYIQ
eukprot:TRINITY_DN20022_c0_g1_i1.p1 TRINITY_DN20022_c0_g1~~TRINITY_DN20022_c0_g1_i1.p1  ORF type:complete len:147 (-),score=21.52 TRINITY_DN20022_c0_g1_i1:9-398(-)